MANKKITEEEINAICENLVSTKSSNRRSAAKKIRKYNLTRLGDELYNAYLKEKVDKRTWETQMEMIQTLGKIGYKKALSEILSIVEKNEKLDMIQSDMVTYATAFAQIKITGSISSELKECGIKAIKRLALIEGMSWNENEIQSKMIEDLQSFSFIL